MTRPVPLDHLHDGGRAHLGAALGGFVGERRTGGGAMELKNGTPEVLSLSLSLFS